MSEPLAYTVATAAEDAAVSPDVIRRAIRVGDLPCRYNGNRPIILRPDLEAWLQSLPTVRAS